MSSSKQQINLIVDNNWSGTAIFKSEGKQKMRLVLVSVQDNQKV